MRRERLLRTGRGGNVTSFAKEEVHQEENTCTSGGLYFHEKENPPYQQSVYYREG